MGAENLFDFAQFNAKPANLDLQIGPAEVMELAFMPSTEIAGAVQARPRGGGVGIGYEALGGQRRTMVVTGGDPGTPDADLTDHPDGSRAARCIQNVHLGVRNGHADTDRRRPALDLLESGPHRRFGRAIQVP